MAHQSPMISIPKKTTEDVDWTGPIRNAISHSYGEDPDNYATECANLQRCRQDAVKGAGSDMTARDLLYKYFGQLELLELRFAEIRVTFHWRDAFTNKLTTQTSLAYEKASIIFQIAATHSAIAAQQNRSDPEGLKRAFYYFRTCAGMLTYINDNFLHAPSTDLSRDVIKFLVGVILAQATEVFFEKCTDEKKGSALVSKIAAQAAFMYSGLGEEVKEFMGKGILDRNWVTIIQAKAKYFTSVAQWYRAQADNAAGKHGDALVRLIVAETNAKEANRIASSFASMFVTQMSPNLPPDAGPTLSELTKSHLALCTEKKAEAQRENDLIYNAVLPSPETLPVIDKAVVATAISIQEVYATPDVQKVIGPDIFIRLVPLSVHESASVYSEEKAKVVRGEVERAENAEVEVRSALEAMGVKEGLVRYKAMAGGVRGVDEDEVPADVRRWKEDISVMESRDGVERMMAELGRLKESVRKELDDTGRELDAESRACEAMRVKYDHLWTQAPSAGPTKMIRQDLKSHMQALDAAKHSDTQVSTLWESVKGEVQLLLSDAVEGVFRAAMASGPGTESLLDVDGPEEKDEEERKRIGQLVEEIDERLERLRKIGNERREVLKDLKDKVQSDDVSHLLLLNRRNANAAPGAETSLFTGELEKFRSYQQRVGASIHHEQVVLQEVQALWRSLRDFAGRGSGAKKWEEKERRKKDAVKRFERARDGYMEVRDGLAKGLQFYNELSELGTSLHANAKSFIASRDAERESLAAQAELERKLSVSTSPSAPPVPPPRPSAQGSMSPGLESSFASMNLRNNLPPPLPPQPKSQNSWHASQPSLSQTYASSPSSSQSPFPPPPAQPQAQRAFPPPPPVSPPQSSYQSPPPGVDPYASLGMFGSGQGSGFSQTSPPPAPPQQPQRQYSYMSAPPPPPSQQAAYSQQTGYSQAPPPPQQPQYSQHQRQGSYPPPPPSQSPYGAPYQQQPPPPPPSGSYGLPPPPPPVNYQSPTYGAPPPPQAGGYGYGAPPQQQQPPPPPQQGYGQYGYGR